MTFRCMSATIYDTTKVPTIQLYEWLAASEILPTLLASYHLHCLCRLQWTAELNAAITQKFFAWLVGPLEVQEAEIEYKGEKKIWKSGVQIKKCRYLEQSGCKGMCINMCKVSPAINTGAQFLQHNQRRSVTQPRRLGKILSGSTCR